MSSQTTTSSSKPGRRTQAAKVTFVRRCLRLFSGGFRSVGTPGSTSGFDWKDDSCLCSGSLEITSSLIWLEETLQTVEDPHFLQLRTTFSWKAYTSNSRSLCSIDSRLWQRLHSSVRNLALLSVSCKNSRPQKLRCACKNATP